MTKMIGAALVLLAASFAAVPVQAQPSCGEARWCAFHNNSKTLSHTAPSFLALPSLGCIIALLLMEDSTLS